MHLLVIILDKAKDVENIIEKFREIGVTGATLYNSIGIGKSTLYKSDIPVIATLAHIFDSESKTFNKTLVSIIKTDETLEKAINQVSGAVFRAEI